jgi:hypothetical protein
VPVSPALFALIQRQRRFEWGLARDEQSRVAGRLVAGRTHDLLNLIQIVELAVFRLRHDGLGDHESLDELSRTSKSASAQLHAMMAVARPEPVITRGAPVAATVMNLIATLREVASIEVHVDVSTDTATRCTARELEHLLIGLVLDAVDQRLVLTVRERDIEGKAFVEIVRGAAVDPDNDGHELLAVTALATRNGGEIATSERSGGGTELIVSLPIVSD